MALIDIGDGWERELQEAEKLHQNVLAQIGERGKHSRKSSAYSQLSDDLRRTLSQFGSQVSSLRDKLKTETRITAGERNRREGIIDSLSRREDQLKELVSRSTFKEINQDKKSLFGRPAVPGSGLAHMGTTGWGEDRPDTSGAWGHETRDTAGMSSQTLKEAQQEAIRDQDAGLDALHSVILRQKSMAAQIGTEIVQQNEIIDDIDERMDSTTQRLLENTRAVRTVDKKDRTCGFWVVIFILALAIIIIAFL